jgi:hypothetical protein
MVPWGFSFGSYLGLLAEDLVTSLGLGLTSGVSGVTLVSGLTLGEPRKVKKYCPLETDKEPI